MDVSVIIPIYGVEKYIEKCLRSLFTQTKVDGVEYILVDDCTQDNSIKIAEKLIAEYPNLNVKLIKQDTNRGLASARAAGVAIAQGKYIQHFDSDDWCEPTMLEDLYRKAIKEDADIVACDYMIDRGCGNVRYMKNIHPDSPVECLKNLLSTKITHSLCFKMIRRELYRDDINYYTEGLDVWEDLVASVKLFYFAKNVTYIPRAYYHYMQVNENSITSSIFSDKKLENMIEAFEDTENFLITKDLSEDLEVNIRDRKIHAKFSVLKRSNGIKQKQLSKLYPEITPYIMRQSGMPFHNRLALWFASRNMLIIFNAIQNTVKKIKR